MGCELILDPEVFNGTYVFKDKTHGLYFTYNKYGEYHTSWDWLMPVVRKIESLNFEIDGVITSADVHIVYGDCRIVDEDGNGLFEFYSHSTDSGDKLGATYKAVVEYIKWYNNKTQCNNCRDMMLMLDEECPDCGRTN